MDDKFVWKKCTCGRGHSLLYMLYMLYTFCYIYLMTLKDVRLPPFCFLRTKFELTVFDVQIFHCAVCIYQTLVLF